MKKIDFRQRAAKTEERKRKSKYADVMVRATVMGLMKQLNKANSRNRTESPVWVRRQRTH